MEVSPTAQLTRELDIEFDMEKEAEEYLAKTSSRRHEICVFYLKSGSCPRGNDCPNHHVKPEKAVVCKHWWRSLCKKGDKCEYLHIFDKSLMPECWFFARNGHCNNEECQFQHVHPEDKMKDCPWYARGFCRNGPTCKSRHVRKQPCPLYLAGFCPDGPNCKFGHPKFALPVMEENKNIICHACGQKGHKAAQCPNSNLAHSASRARVMASEQQPPRPVADSKLGKAEGATEEDPSGAYATLHEWSEASYDAQGPRGQIHPPSGGPAAAAAAGPPMGAMGGPGMGGMGPRKKNLSEVMCFKCRQFGHYANSCPQQGGPRIPVARFSRGVPGVGGGNPNFTPMGTPAFPPFGGMQQPPGGQGGMFGQMGFAGLPLPFAAGGAGSSTLSDTQERLRQAVLQQMQQQQQQGLQQMQQQQQQGGFPPPK